MTQEENAKTYTELINRLEDVKNAIKKQNYGIAMDILYKPYPEFQITTSTELKESEDEKIKKTLIHIVKGACDKYGIKYQGKEIGEEKLLAWIERRCEQKPMPIFKVGDTIIAKDGTYIEKEPFHIDMIDDDCYWDGESSIFICNQDEFELIEQKPTTMSLDEAIEHCKEKSCSNNACALEHKQLAQWLKELKGYKEQKSAWGEEDEKLINSVIELIDNGALDRDEKDYFIEKLKSLKDRYTWKPSDEQMNNK